MQPDQFIALAEETGQIVPLGSWVLTRASADLARWRQNPRGLYVSVNVSARQFSAPGFVDGVRRTLEESGLEPGALMLELTESVLLRRDERVHADLTELKTIGVRLAIDDFGTGYSSLSYLRELPIDVLISMGCQFGQGYLLAMPMAGNQAETLARIGSHQVPSLPRQSPEPAKPTLPAPG